MYLRGGAERYMFDLMALLTSHGHEVIPFSTWSSQNRPTPYEEYFVSEVDFASLLDSRTLCDKVRATRRVLYSVEARDNLLKLLHDTKPDLVHVFGFAHHLSASIFDATRRAGVPVIQSQLDYKWLCPNTTFLSHGEVCEQCKVHRYFNVALRRCKRDSVSASLLAGLQAYHGTLAKAADKISVFLCHSQFLMNKMMEYGFPRERFRYVPHFLDLDGYPNPDGSEPYAVYFGRFSYEKGLQTLLRAAEIADVELRIIGKGPEEESLQLYAREHALSNVHFLGPRWGQEMQEIVSKARCVVCPSEWYENSPLAIYESMAMGRPVVGAQIGGIPELVQDKVTGLLFPAGDASELAAKMRYLVDQPDIAHDLGREARRIVGEQFTPQKHYEDVMAVYRDTLSHGQDHS